MDIYQTVLEVIDFRSFSNLWYWIALAVLWSSASRYVLGVPYEMIQRARRHGGQHEADVEALLDINIRRFLGVSRTAAMPLFAFTGFVLSALTMLAFWYDVEFAQAIFFLAAPMVIVGWLTLRTSHAIEEQGLRGDAMYRRLLIHRRMVQGVGMVAIFVTALYGMYQNLNVSVIN